MISLFRSPSDATSGNGIGGTDDHDEVAADETARIRPRKSAEAFRTISEVADELNVPQHVLRFWETKFPRIKPLKRGGGRRYYRPEDVSLLRHIANLLYIQGYTIKGVQRLLKESGGVLPSDIPPASAAEKAEAAAEQTRQASVAQSLMGESLVDMPASDKPKPLAPQAPSPAPIAASSATDFKQSAEAEHLRAILMEILQALETLRASLARPAESQSAADQAASR